MSPLVTAYKISVKSEIIYNTRGQWRHKYIPKVTENSNGNISTPVKYKNSNMSILDIEEENKDHETNQVNKIKTRIISKYGIVEDYRESKILSSRRMNLRRHTLTTVNVIVDSNETKNHLDDRL